MAARSVTAAPPGSPVRTVPPRCAATTRSLAAAAPRRGQGLLHPGLVDDQAPAGAADGGERGDTLTTFTCTFVPFTATGNVRPGPARSQRRTRWWRRLAAGRLADGVGRQRGGQRGGRRPELRGSDARPRLERHRQAVTVLSRARRGRRSDLSLARACGEVHPAWPGGGERRAEAAGHRGRGADRRDRQHGAGTRRVGMRYCSVNPVMRSGYAAPCPARSSRSGWRRRPGGSALAAGRAP